jgi:acetate kinase
MKILTINAGSSSLRLALFERRGADLVELFRTHHEANESGGALAATLERASGAIDLVAHRIVHGGRRNGSCRIDAGVEQEIVEYAPLAPLHNPVALQWLQACRRLLGGEVPQIAVFDTAFYADLPPVAAAYPLPVELCREHGLRRYGFHGIAHAAMWRRWSSLHPGLAHNGRVISLQLGAGCSATAVAQGRAIDTSMGFTPIEGLMMALRSGDIDPGLLIHLQRRAGLSVEALEDVLIHRSGLRGVSDASGDMRELLRSPDPRAALAVEMFCYRVRKYIGAYLAVLGGADAVLFGGGIGEHQPEVRQRILAGLEGLGLALDPERNAAAVGNDACISRMDSRIEVRVVPVDEERMLAEEAVMVTKRA